MNEPRPTSMPSQGKPRGRFTRKLLAAPTSVAVRHARRAVVFVLGTTVVAIGGVMLVTPGPALLVIPLGLGILAIEFAWARRLLKRIKNSSRNLLASDSEDDPMQNREKH